MMNNMSSALEYAEDSLKADPGVVKKLYKTLKCTSRAHCQMSTGYEGGRGPQQTLKRMEPVEKGIEQKFI